MTVPAERPAPLVETSASAPSQAESRGGGGQLRILIVEDDFLIALDLQEALIEAGFLIAGVADRADRALQIAAAEQPDLALVDIRILGPADGIDTAIQLRERFGVPSIFASAHADEQTRRRADLAKPLGWIQKPYFQDTLASVLRELAAATG